MQDQLPESVIEGNIGKSLGGRQQVIGEVEKLQTGKHFQKGENFGPVWQQIVGEIEFSDMAKFVAADAMS